MLQCLGEVRSRLCHAPLRLTIPRYANMADFSEVVVLVLGMLLFQVPRQRTGKPGPPTTFEALPNE